MKRKQVQGATPRLVAFLGNPGSRYEKSRHNVAWIILEDLSSRWDLERPNQWKEKFHGRFLKHTIRGREVILLRPDTYMNHSGRSVRAAADFFNIQPQEVLVIHDDLDTAFGTVQLLFAGGHRGQNGARSVAQHLGTTDFWHLRVGIGRPPGGRDPAAWVLERFDQNEEPWIAELCSGTTGALERALASEAAPKEMTETLFMI